MFNMGGRKKVENGDLCERKNGRGVDTNRNWDIHWGFQEKDYDPSEEYPGTAPFRCALRCNATFTKLLVLREGPRTSQGSCQAIPTVKANDYFHVRIYYCVACLLSMCELTASIWLCEILLK